MESYIIYVILLCIILLLVSITKYSKKDKWVDNKEFEKWKILISRDCSESTFIQFLDFMQNYKGGFVRRKSGQIICQNYLGREKGDLKGIFYNVVVPNPKLPIELKEKFRKCILSIGVQGVNNRPIYEKRDGKLKNKANGELEKRKSVGNYGEKIVRDYLSKLNSDKYIVISGVMLQNGGILKEYDHIVIGNDIVFILETKAFGISGDNGSNKANLYIDKGDNWKMTKWGQTRDIESPTNQVHEEKQFLEGILNDSFVTVEPVLVLANPDIEFKQYISLDYKIMKLENLNEYIYQKNNDISMLSKFDILKLINSKRVN